MSFDNLFRALFTGFFVGVGIYFLFDHSVDKATSVGVGAATGSFVYQHLKLRFKKGKDDG